MLSDLPLVSAVMPTQGRRQWAAEAVEMFLAQTYPNKELVVIDDCVEPSFPYGRDDVALRLATGMIYYPAQRAPLGSKRNLSVAMASGDVIMHWDSDDIYTTDRMEHQVGLLLANDQVDLVGYHRAPFIETDGAMRRGEYCGLPEWAFGGSFCYWRWAWERRAFSATLQEGEDSEFLRHVKSKSFESGGRITIRIHSGNTSEKRGPIAGDRATWRVAA